MTFCIHRKLRKMFLATVPAQCVCKSLLFQPQCPYLFWTKNFSPSSGWSGFYCLPRRLSVRFLTQWFTNIDHIQPNLDRKLFNIPFPPNGEKRTSTQRRKFRLQRYLDKRHSSFKFIHQKARSVYVDTTYFLSLSRTTLLVTIRDCHTCRECVSKFLK